MGNNIFSLPRFGSYFKLTLRQSGFLLRLFIASLSVFVLLTTIIPYLTSSYPSDSEPHFIGNHQIDRMWLNEIGYFIPGFFLIIAMCSNCMFSTLNSKEKRINTLMLPASYLEKYTSYFILYVIGGFIIFFIAAYASDIIRVLIAPLYAPEGTYIKIMPLDYFFSHGTCYDLEDYVGTHRDFTIQLSNFLILGGALTLQAYFALAGILWHKHSITKGIGVGIGLTTLYIFTCIESLKIFDKGVRMVPRFVYLEDFNTFITSAWVTTIIFIMALYVISYFRFKESESINRW